MEDRKLQKRIEASERVFFAGLGGLLCIVVVLVRELLLALGVLP